MSQAGDWVQVCGTEEIDEEDVIRFDHGDRTFAIYRTADNEYYATDGMCTHGQVHLSDGLVMGNLIECPKHNGRFDLTTGAAKRLPACKDLAAYPVRVANGNVYLLIT